MDVRSDDLGLPSLPIPQQKCCPLHFITIWVKFHPTPPHTPTPSLFTPLPRQSLLDLPLELGKYHGKFGDINYYRNQMQKEHIRKIQKFSVFFQKLGGTCPHPPLATPTPCPSSPGPREVRWKVW